MQEKQMSPMGEEIVDSDVEQGINPMEQLLDDYLAAPALRRGQIVKGEVVQIDPQCVVVDVGAKCEGIVPQHDLAKVDPERRESLEVGQDVLVYVVNPSDVGGSIGLSISQAQVARDWQEAERLLDTQETTELPVIDCNKGGVIVKLNNLRGFVPGSQLGRSRVPEEGPDEERWRDVVGETLKLKVIEVDEKRNRLILSERYALRDWRKRQRGKLLEELTAGQTRQGRVINLTDFGAFVDLGGIDGLIHISELSWQRVDHPSEVLNVGDEVEVYVLKVDRERERIALSLKKTKPDPWDSVEGRYEEDQLAEVVITRLTKWGAFASIVGDEAIEGLIHISELSDRNIAHPNEVVESGQRVTARILSVDGDRHRMALSLKEVSQGEFVGDSWDSALEDDPDASPGSLSVALSEAMESSEEAKEEDTV